VRSFLTVTAVVVAALVVPSAASAKWCLRITARPAAPTVGTAVTLRFQTLEEGKPTDIGSVRQMVLLQPPRGQPIALDLRRRRDNHSIWQTTFVFRMPGLWRLRSIDETPIPPSCRGRLALRVRPAS
jgi:hypothetical protein